MSCSLFFSLHARLRPGTPAAVIEWLEARIAGRDDAPGFAVEEPAAPYMEDVGWLLGLPGAAHLTVTSVSADGSSEWYLTAHARLHDDSEGGVWGLPFLLAPYCEDGMVATAWSDLDDVSPILFLVQDGVAFVGGRGQPPMAVAAPDGPEPVWRLGHDPVDPAELERYGAPAPESTAADGDQAGEAVLARHLFVRSVLRAVENAGDGRADVERGARAVLDALDAGGDPSALEDSPGWTLQEVRGDERRRPGLPAPSGRPLRRLGAAADALGSARLDAGPHPLRAGDRVRSLPGLRLGAHGPTTYYDDPHTGHRTGTSHILSLEPTPGTLLEVTKVHGRGHAECLPVDGDWVGWIVPSRFPSPLPDHLLYDAAEYAVGVIDPADEGRLFTVEPT